MGRRKKKERQYRQAYSSWNSTLTSLLKIIRCNQIQNPRRERDSFVFTCFPESKMLEKEIT
jgi:hypothetical protein